jgi:hypothetical protein
MSFEKDFPSLITEYWVDAAPNDADVQQWAIRKEAVGQLCYDKTQAMPLSEIELRKKYFLKLFEDVYMAEICMVDIERRLHEAFTNPIAEIEKELKG